MLTDPKLRSLKPKPAVYRMADANGLCIEVRPTGTKVSRYRYRYLGKASIITIDEYPSTSLQVARAERDRLRALLRGGANPSQVAKAERAAHVERVAATFSAVALELLAKRAKEGLTPG